MPDPAMPDPVMTDPATPAGGFSDIRRDDWVARLVPVPARPYARLARLDRPIGTWLLLFPGWWSIALAGHGRPDWRLMALFAVGALVMRSAGCVVNDILDRKFDAEVERTRLRPIPSGEITVPQALVFLAVLLCAGLAVLLALNGAAILLGAASLVLVGTYPLMKRIMWWPQAFLGLTFNYGALLGWAAATGTLGWPAVILYAGGLFWTLGYDTIYAFQDYDDDVRIGVKGTAVRLGRTHARAWIGLFMALELAATLVAGRLAGLGWTFDLALVPAALHLYWQVATLDAASKADCLDKFRANRWYGWLVLLAIMAAR